MKTYDRSSSVFKRKYLLLFFAFIMGAAMTMFFLVQAATVSAAAIGQEALSPVPVTAPILAPVIDEQIQATDLVIQTKVNQQTVRPGGWLTFTVTYTNTRATAISNVLINSTLSTRQIYLGQYQSNPVIPTSQFTYTGAPIGGYTLKWTFPTLAPGTGEIVFKTQVMTDTGPVYTNPTPLTMGNTATISAPDATGSTNDDVAMVVGPVLKVSKTDTPATVLPGHFLTYTLTLQNIQRTDSIAATNIVITDKVPLNTTFYSVASGGVYITATNSVVWHVAGPFPPGGSQTLQFVVLVSDHLDSDSSIKNDKADYLVFCTEMFSPLKGYNTVTTPVDAVLLKTVKDINGDTSPSVYPSQELTYTITVHNPLNQALSGVIVTDTVPGIPGPFTYVRPGPGSPTPTVVDGGRRLRWVIDLPAWGSYTFSVVVRVPNNTCVPDDKTSTTFKNQLYATHPSTYFSTESSLATVTVRAPLILNKTATPDHAMPGESIVYEIEIENRGPFVISGIRLTDTMDLDGGFFYVDMVQGPLPLPAYITNPVVWDGLALGPNTTYTISFEAEVHGYWLETYKNSLDAYSADACIPANTGLAGVFVDPPLGVNKTVSPEEIFVGDEVRYDYEIFNYSDVVWTMDQIKDYMDEGFVQVGTGLNPAVINFAPPVNVQPGNSYEGFFNVEVQTVDCTDLPKTYPNRKYSFQMHFTSPASTWTSNAANLAPLTIYPNILVNLTSYRRVVQPGNIVTYTLTMQNVSPTSAENSIVQLTLPPDFIYLGTLSGPVPTESSGVLTWSGLDVPSGETVTVVFKAQTGATLGTRTTYFSGTAIGVCFGRMTGGKVSVVEDVVVLTKKALNKNVPPLALVDFDISIQNKDDYDFILPAITDTLPAGFTYFSMIGGPAPIVQGNQLIWNNILIPGSGTARWRLRTQAASDYGTYFNHLAAYSPETIITAVDSIPPVAVQPLVDLKKDPSVTSSPPGANVVYTITLINMSQVTYSSVRVTDTMPTGFTFLNVLPGNVGSTLIDPNPVRPVWMIAQLKSGCAGGCIVRIGFLAKVGDAVSPGSYCNTVIGESPSGSVPGPICTAWITVTQVTPPLAFGKSAPTNGATNISTDPTLSWQTSEGAVSYEYCYDTTAGNTCEGSWTNVEANTSAVLTGLATNTTYYWQARAVNNGGNTEADGGTWWSFTTTSIAPPGSFGKTAPANGAGSQPTNPTLSWGASSGAVSYEYCYDTVADNECAGTWVSVGASTSASISGLDYNTTYYWQVRAVNTGGNTEADGTWWSFSTQSGPPASFEKISPVNGAVDTLINTALNWEASNGATSYEYCFDTTADSACGGTWTDVGVNTSANPVGLTYNTTYYWQVRAKNAMGTTGANGGVWWSFKTQIAPPGAFNKTSPATGATNLPNNPILSWASSTGATSYEYCYDTSNDTFCDGSWVSVGAQTNVNVFDLSTGTTYYWQVRAVNSTAKTEANSGVWWSFTTTTVPPPGDFAKLSPVDDATGVPFTTILSWGESAGATSYEYCFDDINNNACDGSWVNAGAHFTATISGLYENVTYYWQVRSLSTSGSTPADGGVWWAFTTLDLPGPGDFNKTSPADGATVQKVNVVLEWAASSGAASYEYCIDRTDDSGCDGSWVNAGTALSVTLQAPTLLSNVTYYWQVRSKNADGTTYADSGTWHSFKPQYNNLWLPLVRRKMPSVAWLSGDWAALAWVWRLLSTQ